MAEREKRPTENGSDMGLRKAEVMLEKMEKRYRYLERKDLLHGKVNYSAMDTAETLGEELVPDQSGELVEDIALAHVMGAQVRQCLSRLSDEERDVIYLLYYAGISERQAANCLSVHHMTVHKRKVRALAKLKKLLEK